MTKCSVCRELAGEDTCIEVGIDARHIENVGKVLRLKLCVACQSKVRDHRLQICFGCLNITWLRAEVKEVLEGRARFELKQSCDKCSEVSGMVRFVSGPYMG